MQAPQQTDSRRRLQTLFNNKPFQTDPPPLPPSLITLCLLSKTGCHTDFFWPFFLHTEEGGELLKYCCVSYIGFMSQLLDPSSKTLMTPHLGLHLSCFCLWGTHKRFIQINITQRPSGLWHCGMLLFLILLSRIVNIIHESLCADPGVWLYWHTGRWIFHNEILFGFFVLASFANIGVKRCGCVNEAEVDSERKRTRRRRLLRLESGLQRPIMKAVSVQNPWSTTWKQAPDIQQQ